MGRGMGLALAGLAVMGIALMGVKLYERFEGSFGPNDSFRFGRGSNRVAFVVGAILLGIGAVRMLISVF